MSGMVIKRMLLLVAIATVVVTGCNLQSPTPTPTSQVVSPIPIEPIYVRESSSDIVRPPGWPWPEFPMLFLANDTSEQLTVRRLDDPSLPALIMEPGVRFATSWSGQFFGGSSAPERRRKELEKGPGIMLGVFDQSGHRRGRIALLPLYLFGGFYNYLCLSSAAEPPWVVESSEVHVTHHCRQE